MISKDLAQYDFQYKVFQHAHWIRIFYHNFAESSYFENNTECMSYVHPYKFSALQEIDVLSPYNKKYEFLLEYPEESFILRWKQAALPTETPKELYKDIGLDVIYYSHDYYLFQGLMLSHSASYSYLDGSALKIDHIRYSICTKMYDNKIPGPMYNNSEYVEYVDVNIVELWLRIEGLYTKTLRNIISLKYILIGILLNK